MSCLRAGKPKEKPKEVSRFDCKWLEVDFNKKHQCIGKLGVLLMRGGSLVFPMSRGATRIESYMLK